MNDTARAVPLRCFCFIPMFLAFALFASASHAALTGDDAAMNQPQQPFRIIGDIYYVGASDVTSYLVVTPQGDILLDGGFAETVPQVEKNIASLGFKLSDVKILINSHAHFDHAGGLAELKRATHASLEVSAPDAALMARGGLGDPGYGDRFHYEPVKADKLLQDGDKVELGGVSLTAHVTPGHTPGCTTWTMKVEESGKPYDVVFLCSATAPGYQLVDNPRDPGIAAGFIKSFAIWKSLPCDVFLGAHGGYYDLQGKFARLERHEPGNPFIDPQGYRDYLDQAEQAFKRELAEQQAAAAKR